MKTELTFKELKAEKIKLLTDKNLLTAKQSMIRHSKSLFNREIDSIELNKINDKIYIIDDLLTGIEAKICDVGFTYECHIKEKLPNGNDYEIWSTYKTIILEKKYPDILSNDDLIEFMVELNLRKDSHLDKIRLIEK